MAFSEIKNDDGVLQVLQAGPQATLAPVDGDLESLLHAAGKPYSFVDFRSVPAQHWLRTPLAARFLRGSETFVWPDHFDGLITIDVPASKVRK
jgi:erythromycin esterase-like protein